MQPFPKWVSWIFIGLLAYIIYMGNQSQNPPESAPAEPVAATTAPERNYDSLRRLSDGDSWYRGINPNYHGKARIKDITAGEGDPVVCGQEVALLLRGTDANGANFDADHNEAEPLRFMVGDAPIAALNEGVIGMKNGGVRQLVAPANFVYTASDKRTLDEISFHLTLETHKAPSSTTMAAIGTTLVRGDSNKEPVRCGMAMKADIRVFDAKGERLYQSDAPVSFTVGKRELALGVDILARGMELQEERLLTIPAGYLAQSAQAGDVPAALRAALRAKDVRFVHVTRTE